jgi:hypothetical protein
MLEAAEKVVALARYPRDGSAGTGGKL